MNPSDMKIVIDAVNNASAVFKQVQGDVQRFSGDAQKGLGNFTKAIEDNRGAIESVRNTSAVAFWSMVSLWWWAVKVAGAFEKYSVILSNALKDTEKAAIAMDMIRETSAKTPFQLEELTQSYISLVNRWFIPTQNEIIKLWDLASSQGKWFQQLVEALLDAQTGEFERLKEFGVRASKEWDKMTFTFRGVKTTVDATDDAVKKYILSLWSLEWVSWQMAAISWTFEGKTSNLSDSLSNLWVVLGKELLPRIKPIIDSMITVIWKLTDWIAANPDLASTIFIVATAVAWLVTALTTVATVAPAMTTLWPIFAAVGTALWWLASGFWTLWTAILWPVGIVIAVIGALYIARETNFLGIRDIVASLVTWITGTFVPAIQNMYNVVVPIIQDLRNSISTIFWSYIQIISDIFLWFTQLFTGDREALSFTLQNIRTNLWIIIQETFGVSFEQLKLIRDGAMLYLTKGWTTTWNNVKTFFVTTWNQVKDIYTNAVNAISAFFGGAGKSLIEQWFTTMIGWLVALMKWTINGVIAWFEAMVNAGIASVNALIDAVNKSGASVGLSVNIPKMPTIALPRFAFGGIVDGPAGVDRVPALLSAGELILNRAQQQNLASQLQNNSGQTVYITFSPQIFGSKDWLAEEIMDSFIKQFRQHTRFESF